MTPEEITKRRADIEAIALKRSELLFQAFDTEDKELRIKLVAEMRDLDPPFCEHERSWASNCNACDEIHKECFPEHYEKCIQCNELCYKGGIKSGKCFDCFQGE